MSVAVQFCKAGYLPNRPPIDPLFPPVSRASELLAVAATPTAITTDATDDVIVLVSRGIDIWVEIAAAPTGGAATRIFMRAAERIMVPSPGAGLKVAFAAA